MDKIKFVMENFWDKVKKAGGVPFVKDAIAMYKTMIDPEVPLHIRVMIAGALVYFIVPTDAIPDIPIVGYVDDAAVIASVRAMASSYIEEHM